MDNTTAGVAISAVASPVWLPMLQSVSDGAAIIAPILGTIWLVVQIIGRTKDILHKDRK
ncbi:hypothetical protein [Mesorhizobium sp. M0598]|uniref:hypothetical protein n=1 Tax=unclassified Mesorhizobium TaxID=325217 RepID=UPI0033377DA1